MINWYAELSEELDNLDKENLTKEEIKKVMNKLKDKEQNTYMENRIETIEFKVNRLWEEYDNRKKAEYAGPVKPHKRGFFW